MGSPEKNIYQKYKHLLVEEKDGIALITMNRPQVLNATNSTMHKELGRIWLDLDNDEQVKVAIITGAGRGFCAGGDFKMIKKIINNPELIIRTIKEAQAIVYNMINTDKPIISAINGVAVGAGLAVALLADISIASENARFTDGHTKLGIAAGDHAAIIWPFLCGMAKAKYYLLTCDLLDGTEAERIGLVSMVVPPDELMPKAYEVAKGLTEMSQPALHFTKRAMNHWLRTAGPIFEYSLISEMLGFFGSDLKRGLSLINPTLSKSVKSR